MTTALTITTNLLDRLSPFDRAAVDPQQVYAVGEFFWIETAFGFAQGAVHGHGKHERHDFRKDRTPGSADIDCYVGVLNDNGDDTADVVLIRPEMPYGALAPHGTLFTLPWSTIQSWGGKLAAIDAEEAARVAKLARYKTLHVSQN